MPGRPPRPRFRITYRLTGTGWSTCNVSLADATVTVTASYLTDALADLMSAVLMILQGAAESRASFEEEPGEFRWLFDAVPPASGGDPPSRPRVRIRILWFDDAFTSQPDESGELRFDQVVDRRALHRALLHTADELLATHAADGYQDKWCMPFPATAHAKLRALFEQTAEDEKH